MTSKVPVTVVIFVANCYDSYDDCCNNDDWSVKDDAADDIVVR